MAQADRQFYDLTFMGMTSFRIQDIGRASQQYKTSLEKWLEGDARSLPVKALSSNIKKFAAVTNRLQDELFGIFGTSLKAATAYNEYLNLLKEHHEQIAREKQASKDAGKGVSKQALAYMKAFPDSTREITLQDYQSALEDEMLRSVAGMANADFGGLHLGRLGISKDSQDVMRLLFLGPDWTASNVISAMKLFRREKTGISGTGTVFSGSEMEQAIYKRFWLRVIIRSAIIMGTINALMAGLDDESAIERAKKAKRRGGFKVLMADISPVIHMLGGDKGVDHYFNASGHFLDIPKIATDPLRLSYHKSSAVLKPTIDLFTGTRFDQKRPTKLFEIGDKGLYTWKTNRRGPLSPSELPAYSLYQMSQLLPIQLRNMYEIAIGQGNFFTGIGKSALGLDFKRSYDNIGTK
jgi:hypothetical protein